MKQFFKRFFKRMRLKIYLKFKSISRINMSLIDAIYNRRIGLLVSRCKDITKNINLVRSYDNNICIKNINRLNK